VPPVGLVGAWSFDEATGSTVSDASGKGNTGTVSGAKRVAGRHGGALWFDGRNDMVTVQSSSSLSLTTGMTLEAWVRPEALGSMWRTVAIKEQTNQLAYALYAGNGRGLPSGHVNNGIDRGLSGTPALTLKRWAHLATTWDGSVIRLYVNGAQVASQSLGGTAVTSRGALRLGGNTVWSEWFHGAIDEVRIYNRALSPAELKADMDRPASTIALAGLNRAATKQIASKRAKKGLRKANNRKRVHRARWLR
jgi:hypothetical protein